MKEKILSEGKVFQPIPPGVNFESLAKQIKDKPHGFFSSKEILLYHLKYGHQNLQELFKLTFLIRAILHPK